MGFAFTPKPYCCGGKKYAIEFSVDEIMMVKSLRTLCSIAHSILTNTPQEKESSLLPENSSLSEHEFETLRKVVASSMVGKRYPGSFLLGRNINGRKNLYTGVLMPWTLNWPLWQPTWARISLFSGFIQVLACWIKPFHPIALANIMPWNCWKEMILK